MKKIEKSVNAEMKAVCTDPMFMGRCIGALRIVTFDFLHVTIEAKVLISMGILRSCIPPTRVKIHSVSLMCL